MRLLFGPLVVKRVGRIMNEQTSMVVCLCHVKFLFYFEEVTVKNAIDLVPCN